MKTQRNAAYAANDAFDDDAFLLLRGGRTAGLGLRVRSRSGWLRSGPAQIILAAFVGIVALMVWASFARIDELVRAHGQIIATARTQQIEAPDGGQVAALLVQEGETVKKGQLVARMEDVRARAAYEDSLSKVAALRASVARLRAEVLGKELVFPPELDAYPAFRENQRALFLRRQQAVNEAVAALQKNLDFGNRELQILEKLLISGDVGQTEVLRLRRQLAETEGQLANARNKYLQESQTDLTKAEEDLGTQEQSLREREALLQHTELRAPMDGLVRKIAVTTLGATLRAGDTVLEMLPLGSALIVEAKFPPSDVGSIKVGQPASVKLDSFDYTIYGNVDGEVSYISPDALSESDARSGEHFFYRVQILLHDSATPSPRREKLPVVTPGMTVMAEIRIRDRTVMSYLAKPILKTFSESMWER